MIIFVGDKPSPKMKPGVAPFQGASCWPRLKEWLLLLECTHAVVNQCDWAWADMYSWHLNQHKLVALGNNASKALKGIPHFKLPHPSGRNRQINDKKFIATKLEECKAYIKGVTNG